MSNLLKLCLTTTAAVALVLAASPAQANAGLPMLYVVWPAMWALLIPIILVEAAVAAKILDIDFIQAAQIAGVANLASTLVGIPVTWVLLLIVQFKAGATGAYGLDTFRGRILSVTLQSPWLVPYKQEWIVPAAELFLCIPFFLMSVWTEFLSARWFTQNKLPMQGLLDWSWLANGLSYSMIAGILAFMLIRALNPRVTKEPARERTEQWLMPEVVRGFAEQAAWCAAIIASFIACGGMRPKPKKPKPLAEIGILACSFCGRGSTLIVCGAEARICGTCLKSFAEQHAESEVQETKVGSIKCSFCRDSRATEQEAAFSNVRICHECIQMANEMVDDKTLKSSASPANRQHPSLFTVSVPLSKDVLNGYLESMRVESVREWLFLVRDLEVPEDYYFLSPDNRELSSDSLLDDVRITLRKTINRHIVPDLSRALRGRNDDESVKLLLELLSDDDSEIRSWAAHSLQDSTSPILAAELPRFIRDQALRTTELTNCAIVNNLDSLHDVYEVFLEEGNDTDRYWRGSAFDYLAAFPRTSDRNLFRSILEGNEDTGIKWKAVRGLGKLCDASSVDLIIDAMRKEQFDASRWPYLEALSRIKGDKAKEVVKSFRRSEDDFVREVVAKLLKAW